MNREDSINRIDSLTKEIPTYIKSEQEYNCFELDRVLRIAKRISIDAFGKSNSFLEELSKFDFLKLPFPGFSKIREQGLIFINILSEMQFEIERLNDPQLNGKNESTALKPKEERLNIESNRVFIVHGHDEEMREAVARLLERLDLKPIILRDQPDAGRTIIEKFQDYSDVNFAVVLFSPDDFVLSNDQSGEEKYRARQNVIFELGYFIGKLDRKHVISLCKDPKKLDLPSDYHGVIYIEYDRTGTWKYNLVRELKACRYDIDANKII